MLRAVGRCTVAFTVYFFCFFFLYFACENCVLPWKVALPSARAATISSPRYAGIGGVAIRFRTLNRGAVGYIPVLPAARKAAISSMDNCWLTAPISSSSLLSLSTSSTEVHSLVLGLHRIHQYMQQHMHQAAFAAQFGHYYLFVLTNSTVSADT